LVSDAAYHGFKWSVVGIAVLAIVIVAVLLTKRSKRADVPDFTATAQQSPSADEDVFEQGEVSDDAFAPTSQEEQQTKEQAPSQDSEDDDIFGEY